MSLARHEHVLRQADSKSDEQLLNETGVNQLPQGQMNEVENHDYQEDGFIADL